MTIDFQGACPFIVNASPGALNEVGELRKQLESGGEETRIAAMKEAIQLLSSASHNSNSIASGLLMTIIRFILPNQKCKLLKKLVLLFFELAPKTDGGGKLLSEMILLCNALRNDLQHPNEYVRGVTLRFLTRIHEPEILEPLVPSVRSCLEHRHAYVRRNAILTMGAIYQNGNDFLIPDTPQVIQTLLSVESDSACLRNAFRVLAVSDPQAAWEWCASVADRISSLDSSLQLAIVAFVIHQGQRASEEDAASMAMGNKMIIQLLQSPSSVVKFEAASALMASMSTTLSPPSVSIGYIKAIASTYVELAVRETDNNAKLMILERYAQLQATHPAIINEDVLEILRILTASDLAIRQRALEIVSLGVTARQSNDLVRHLANELGKQQEGSSPYEKANEYRASLLVAIDACASRFPSVSATALTCFIDLLRPHTLGSFDEKEQISAVKYIKELLQRNSSLCKGTIPKLLEVIPEQVNSHSLAGLLWIIGDITGIVVSGGGISDDGQSTLKMVIDKVKELVGPLPWRPEMDSVEPVPSSTGSAQESVASKKRVNADGTYATESALTAGPSSTVRRDVNIPILRDHVVIKGSSPVATALAITLCKLASHAKAISLPELPQLNATFMLIITSTLKVSPVNRDTFDRLMMSLRFLSNPITPLSQAFHSDCQRAFESYLSLAERTRHSSSTLKAQADDEIEFRFPSSAIAKKNVTKTTDDLQLALGGADTSNGGLSPMTNLLSKVVQLTGFSDEIYAETYVTISHSDIILDVLLVNQTDRMLQGVTIELATGGDLSVTEKPVSLLLSPRGFAVAKASLKVRSTDNGLIFGCISYNVSGGGGDTKSIVLSTLNIDVSEYIRATSLSDQQFRAIWPTLEWENKIVIPSISSHSLSSLMSHMLGEAHLACITADYGINETGDYLAANLHAVSTFGEEILANICLEAGGEGVTGHLRLRSKTQGIAIALGDRITEIVTKLDSL